VNRAVEEGGTAQMFERYALSDHLNTWTTISYEGILYDNPVEKGCGMKKQTSLKNIEKIIESLTPDEQLSLVERLAQQLRKKGLPARKDLAWGKLYGLGKGLWKEDAQTYINRS
jgi:hypothetical protein